MSITVEELINFDPLNYPTKQVSDEELNSALERSKELLAEEKRRSRVYFIQAEETAIKIGFTLDVERRFLRMQMDCPLNLYLLAVIKGDRKLEGKIHRKFKKYRLKGEWFEVHENIIDYAKNNSIDINRSYRLKNIPKL